MESTDAQSSGWSSPAQDKHDIDVCFYLDRLAIQQIGSVGPLPHRIDGWLLQHRRTGEHLEFFEVTIFTDDAIEDDRTLDAL